MFSPAPAPLLTVGFTSFANACLRTTFRATRAVLQCMLHGIPPLPDNRPPCLWPLSSFPDVEFRCCFLRRPLSPDLRSTRSTPVRCDLRALSDPCNPCHLPASRINHLDASTYPSRHLTSGLRARRRASRGRRRACCGLLLKSIADHHLHTRRAGAPPRHVLVIRYRTYPALLLFSHPQPVPKNSLAGSSLRRWLHCLHRNE